MKSNVAFSLMLALSLSQFIRLYLESLHFFFRALHLLFALRFCLLLSSERDKSPFHKRSSIQACADTLHLLSHALHGRSVTAVRLHIFCHRIVEGRLTFTYTLFKRLYLTPSTDHRCSLWASYLLSQHRSRSSYITSCQLKAVL